jgi:hypothetical protein
MTTCNPRPALVATFPQLSWSFSPLLSLLPQTSFTVAAMIGRFISPPASVSPFGKVLDASLPASLLLIEHLLDPHRAPPLQKFLCASLSADLLLTLPYRHSRGICSRFELIRMCSACRLAFRWRLVGSTGSSVPPLMSRFIGAFP